MKIDRAFLIKWCACWDEKKIAALGMSEMTPAQVVNDERILLIDRTWAICRVLISHSREALSEFANHCKIEAKKSADNCKNAVAAAYAAYAAAAAYAADAAAVDAVVAAAYAAKNQSCRANLAFALTLLPDNGNS